MLPSAIYQMIENKLEHIVLVDDQEFKINSDEEPTISYDSGSVTLSVGEAGQLLLSSKGHAMDEIRINDRDMPRWLKQIELYPGTVVRLGASQSKFIEVPVQKGDGDSQSQYITVKSGSNRITVRPNRLVFLGKEDNDTRAMLRWDGRNSLIAAVREKDLAFVYNGKANYLLPYCWYSVSPKEELRFGGVNGYRIDIPEYEHFPPSTRLDSPDVSTEPPILYIDSARLNSLVNGEMELDARESEKLPRSPFLEHLLCSGLDRALETGWRLRNQGLANRREFIYSRRLADDYPSMIEISSPDHRSNPREYYERADFILSRVRHPHLVKVLEYGTFAHPNHKYGDYHVRVQDRVNGVGLLQVLNQCGRFDGKTALSVMIPVVDALKKAASVEADFRPSRALIETRQKFGPDKEDMFPSLNRICSDLFSVSQIWLCVMPDGRLIAKVDAHVPDNHTEISFSNVSEYADLGVRGDTEEAAVVATGRVLYKLITGRTFRLKGAKLELSKELSGFDSRLEELALSCIVGKPLDRPKTLAAVQKLMEEVWRYMHF